VPKGFNDSEMAWVLHDAILPIARRLKPVAIMLQCGADALEEDPLSRLRMSNQAHWAVVRALMAAAPRVVLLGGGGGRIEGGRVLDYTGKPDRQMCRLYLSIMDKMDVRLPKFGDASLALEEV
jgi:hypothetical protein